MILGIGADTRALLASGAAYWSNEGPAALEDELVALIGLQDWEAAGRHFGGLKRRLDASEAVSVLDLTRLLFVTELGIASVVVGPMDWHNLFGAPADYDAFMIEEFTLLRAAQDELGALGVPASGTDPFCKRPLPG